MSWRIVMIEQGEYLRLKLDNLYIQKGKSDYTVPLGDISIVIISNLDTVLSTRLMDAFASHNIGLVVCDYKHQPSGLFTGLNTHSRSSKIIKQQIQWSDAFKDYTWSLIVKSKIQNQKTVLELFTLDHKNITLLEGYIDKISLGDATNREGHAAKVYFNSIFDKDFTRSEDDDIRNACLNYIYAVVRAFFARLIVGYGFSGMIGLHHKSEYNNFNLVDDLMEPFRPICDQYVLDLLKLDSVFDLEMRIALVDFLHQEMNYEGKKMLVANVIEKYIHSFIRYCKEGDTDAFVFPRIEND